MTSIANFVQQASVSTGAGPMVLTPAAGCRSFASAFGTGGNDMFFYFIRHRSAPEWEVGTGHMADAATLVRDNVISSSNGGAKVSFSAGDKDIVNDIAAERQMILPAAPVAGDMLLFDGTRWQAARPAVGIIDGLNAALAAKAGAAHGHGISHITGLQTALDAKAASLHSHDVTDIESLAEALDSKADAAHGHALEDVAELNDALSGKADVAHSHSAADIEDLENALANYAATTHTHDTSDITGLSTALAAKAAAAHGHDRADIEGLEDVLSGKADSNHSHSIANISGLQSALDAKAAASRSIATEGSITGGGDLTANRSLSLHGDEETPGNEKYYGTDDAGIKGFHALPAFEPPAACDIEALGTAHLIATGADVQTALTQIDSSLQQAGFHPRRSVSFNHFTGGDNGPFMAATSGTAANAATIENDYTVNTDALGVYRMTTGTTASGAAWRSLGAASIMMHDPEKILRLKSRIRLANLTAPGSQEIRVWGGITAGTAANTNPASTIGMYWYYDKENAHWALRRRNAGYVYDVATDVTVEAGVWYDMELAVYGASTDNDVECELFINGVSKAVNSQLIGSMGYNAVSAAIQKAAGTTARLLYIDYEALFMGRGS